MLADGGIYLASKSTSYRILKAEDQLHHRGNGKPRGTYTRPVSYTARDPNQVWSWDITHLPGEVKGERYYLYMIMDVYSRKSWLQKCGKLNAVSMQRPCYSVPLSWKTAGIEG